MTTTSLSTDAVVELDPGLWRIRTSMDGHSFGALNTYLLKSDDGDIVIDMPWARPEVLDAFADGLERAGSGPDRVAWALATHYHEDHSGAAGWLQSHGAKVGMHREDAEALQDRFGGGDRFVAELERWIGRVGPDDEGIAYSQRQFRELSAYADGTRADRLLDDGDVVTSGPWTVEAVHTPGHTPGHLCFVVRDRGLLFVGDHVFDRRRTNATSRPFAVDRPIRRYWESTDRLLALGIDTAYPGHDGPVEHLPSRMGRLRTIRDAKLEETTRLAAGSTAWEIAQRVQRRTAWEDLDGNAKLAAAGEVLAYLLDLADDGRVVTDGGTPDRWTRVAPPHDHTQEGEGL